MNSKVLPLPLLLLPLLIVIGTPVSAQERQGRPWGRLDNPVQGSSVTTSPNGYTGRYNPWIHEGTSQEQGHQEQPRYRDHQSRSETTYRQAPLPYTGPRVQSAYPHYDSSLLPGYGYVPPYSGSYPAVTPGMSPWFGGINPNYGNYWNDPYETLRPDTGLLWSDMWRW